MNKNIFHILVVDDDDRIRELTKQYLEENNFLVTSAKDALDARKKLEIVKFDILILDIMMPGESGLSLTKEVKKKQMILFILRIFRIGCFCLKTPTILGIFFIKSFHGIQGRL